MKTQKKQNCRPRRKHWQRQSRQKQLSNRVFGGSSELERRRASAKRLKAKEILRAKRSRAAFRESLRTTTVDANDVATLQIILRDRRRSTTEGLSDNFIDVVVPFIMRPYEPVPPFIEYALWSMRIPRPQYSTMTQLELINIISNIPGVGCDYNISMLILKSTSQDSETDAEQFHTGNSTTEYSSSSAGSDSDESHGTHVSF